jgi:signal transduction histidine kinase
MQRQQLAESQIVDRQARRVLHDEVLPSLHAAMLTLNGGGSASEVVQLLADTHRRIANLLQVLPATVSSDVARLGLLGALRQAVEHELSHDFETVDWAITPVVEAAALRLPPLMADVTFHAAREVLRNAARYGRGDDQQRPLRLTITARLEPGLVLIIADDGVGLPVATAPSTAGTGRGLVLHSTMMTIVGGALSLISRPGQGTSVRLSTPPLTEPERRPAAW